MKLAVIHYLMYISNKGLVTPLLAKIELYEKHYNFGFIISNCYSWGR